MPNNSQSDTGAPGESRANLGVYGAPNRGAGSAGAAYVYVRTAGVWIQQAYLKPASVGTTQAGDGFGISVAISGDTVGVGAAGEESASLGVNSTPNESASGAGAAYVFERTAGVWSQQAYLKPGNAGTTQAGDQFGRSVAASGEIAVVGAYQEDSASLAVNGAVDEDADGAGAAYVYVRTGGVWSRQAYLKPANAWTTQAGDQFGGAVAVAGESVVVGAYREDSASLGVNSVPNESAGDAGAAYVFVRTAGVWRQQAYLKPASFGTIHADDRFGVAVAVSGDTVVVGAIFEDSATLGVNTTPNERSRDSGAAYVFVRAAGVWSQQAYLKSASIGTSNGSEHFGYSVAASGETVVVGADNESSATLGVNSTPNESAEFAGAAYVWRRSGPFITEVIDAGSLRPEIAASAWVSIKGTDLASTTRIWAGVDFVQDRLPAVLDGISVPIDGKRAANLDGTIAGKAGLFPSARNANQPLPARGGRALVYGTGWGLTNPATPEGTVFSGAYPLASAVSIKIGGVPVAVEFAGVVTPGLYQFNIVSPDLPPSDYPIEGTIGGFSTQGGGFITLGPPAD